MAQRVREEITLHPKQMEVFSSPHRFKVVVAGRRWGKSRLSLASLQRNAVEKRKRRCWYIAPTYRMAKQIMWQELLDMTPRRIIDKINHSTLTIILKNGSEISLKGADKPDTLRGVALDFVVLDEFQDMRKEVWSKVIRPTLSSTGGGALIIGTPKAFNYLYDLFMLGQKPELRARGQWKSWQFVTADSPFVPLAEIESAKEDLDQASFRQEYMASFESMSGRVYYAFSRDLHVKECRFNPKLPIWIGQDFNIDPMSSIVLQPQPNGEVWAIDEVVLYGSNTEEVCDELERLYWRHKNSVTIYPDPAGGARQHARGESDIDIFRERGFKKLSFHRKHPAISDRVNAVNRMLLTASGTVRLRIDPRCKTLIQSLEQVIYKPGGRDIDKSQGLEHITDAIGYCLHREFPLRDRAAVGFSF